MPGVVENDIAASPRRIEERTDAQHQRRPVAVGERTGERLRRAPQQHLDREREPEHVAAPAVFGRHRREEETEA
jgi:hypothetical protein